MEALVLRKKRFSSVLKTEWPLYLFLAPAVAVTIFFAYLPMFSNIIAFMEYNIYSGWLGLQSKFVGFQNFVTVLNDKATFYPLVWRTFYYSVVRLVTGQPAPFILALLINELRRRKFKRVGPDHLLPPALRLLGHHRVPHVLVPHHRHPGPPQQPPRDVRHLFGVDVTRRSST